MWQRLLLIAFGGAAGSLLRFGLGGWVNARVASHFPWGTLAVNALGCLLFGIVASVLAQRTHLEQHVAPLLLVGFIGAFTTFSTFAHDTHKLMDDGRWLHMGANLLLQNVVGVALVIVGVLVGRWL